MIFLVRGALHVDRPPQIYTGHRKLRLQVPPAPSSETTNYNYKIHGGIRRMAVKQPENMVKAVSIEVPIKNGGRALKRMNTLNSDTVPE